jgi:SagB-type dehydrogenase family enzyme
MALATEIDRLPSPAVGGRRSVERALEQRRSVREYARGGVTRAELGQLLWAAQGITGEGTFRTAPSAGALYPLEVYVAAGEVCDLSPAIYRYRPERHCLTLVVAGDQRGELCAAAWGQECVGAGAAVIAIAAVYTRTTAKYGDRGLRYVQMEAGHAAQNVHLQAWALGLGAVVVGAFDDSLVKTVMHMALEETPLSLMPVGRSP